MTTTQANMPALNQVSAKIRKITGAASVRIVTRCFEKRGRHVTNVEGIAEFERIDIDLLVGKNQNIGTTKVEVKGDTKAAGSGNIVIETVSNLELGNPGWPLYSQSEMIAYCIPEAGNLLFLPTKAFREWILDNARRWRAFATQTPVGHGPLYTTCGRLVPATVLLEEVHGATILDISDVVREITPSQHIRPMAKSREIIGRGWRGSAQMLQVEAALFEECRNGNLVHRLSKAHPVKPGAIRPGSGGQAGARVSGYK